MSWDSWDDDDSRPRRRRPRHDDDPYLRQGEPPHSGAVTAAGVVTIIMGVLCLLCGVCSGFFGVITAGVGHVARQQGNVLPPAIFENLGAVLLTWALLHLILGVGQLIAGIVTLQRRRWGRTLTLILTTGNALLGLFLIGLILLAATSDQGLFGNADPDELIGQAVILGFIALIYCAHAIFVYIVLCNSHNREEFD